MQKRITDAPNTPQAEELPRTEEVTIDMSGIDDSVSDEEKLEIFEQALKNAVKGRSTIANPSQKPPHIQTGEKVKEKFGISLNLLELEAQNAHRYLLLRKFTDRLMDGGIDKVRAEYRVTNAQTDDSGRYSVILIDTDTEKFSCEFEIISSPGAPDVPIFFNFRGSTHVSSLEDGDVRLVIFADESGEVHYDIQQLEG